MDGWPLVGSGSSMELEDFENLVDFRVSVEKGALFNQLCENTTDSPDINAQTVLFLTEEDLGSPIPQSLDLMGESFDWDTKSARKSKISDFQVAITIN